MYEQRTRWWMDDAGGDMFHSAYNTLIAGRSGIYFKQFNFQSYSYSWYLRPVLYGGDTTQMNVTHAEPY